MSIINALFLPATDQAHVLATSGESSYRVVTNDGAEVECRLFHYAIVQGSTRSLVHVYAPSGRSEADLTAQFRAASNLHGQLTLVS